MKKLYFTSLVVLLAFVLNAQTESAISACKTESGEIHITFDLAKNCTSGPANSADSLGSHTEIGFHSGANGWAVVREWNHATAVTAHRITGPGNTAVFEVVLTDPAAYYGLSAAPDVINFVFNDGAKGNPSTPNFPWYAEGKEQGAGACLDFFITVAELQTCATNTHDLGKEVSVSITPNPMGNVAVMTFTGLKNENYQLSLLNLNGQEVRSYKNVAGSVEIQRNDLPQGTYFAVLKNAEGRALVQKLVID